MGQRGFTPIAQMRTFIAGTLKLSRWERGCVRVWGHQPQQLRNAGHLTKI